MMTPVSTAGTTPTPAEPSSGDQSQADARDTHPEPFEHTLGSPARPAESHHDAPSTPTPPASPESPASESSDDDQ